MAITNEPVATVDETVVPTVDRAFVASPIGWSSIFAATAITLGVWLALHLLGLAIGLTAIDPHAPRSLRAVGIGTGIWSLIAPIIALFIGGLVAGRSAPTINSVNAAIHGAVVWAVSAILSILLIAMTIGAATRMAVRTGSAMGSGASAAIGKLEDVDLGDLGLTSEDLVAPINERLAQRGMPPVSAAEIQGAARDALRQAVRTGHVDREALIESVVRRTNLSREDAAVLADDLGDRIDRARIRASSGIEHMREAALSAAETSGKLLFALFGTLALSLVAAIGGSVLAVRRERRTHVHLPRATTRTIYTEPAVVEVERR